MVQMSMGKNHRIYAARVNRELCPVQLSEILQSLEEAAIDKYAMSIELEQMFSPSDRSGAT